MATLELWLNQLNMWVWGAPLLILLIGTGVYLTVRLGGLQIRYLPYAFKLVFRSHKLGGEGDISHFEALMTALAATIGVGTIAGVATAVAVGGLGAIFWMVIVGLIGMATKYSEALLAVQYRCKDRYGRMAGGPMYYIEKGLGWKWLGILFALFGAITALGTGNLVQAHSVADTLFDLFGLNPWLSGVLLSIFVGMVILGGIQSIGSVSSYLVPFMALFYFAAGMYILAVNWSQLGSALQDIFHAAFCGQAACGGFLGCTMLMGIQEGVSKGIFSNESGLGSAPIAAAAARTDHPGRQAMIAMMGTFFTLVVTTMTGLIIAVSGVLGKSNALGQTLDGAPLTIHAFKVSIPGGGIILSIGLILFAFSTIVGWAYYGERCCEYLLGSRSIKIYRIIFTLVVIPGAAFSLRAVWNLSGIMNGLMAIPNLIGLIGLAGIVSVQTRSFLALVAKEKAAAK